MSQLLSPRIQIAEQGPEFSQIVLGLWRLSAWQMSVSDRVKFLEQALELGITTIDQADIYGDYTSESLLGEAFAFAPELTRRFQIVTKCGIQFRSAQRPHQTSHIYDTSAQHITLSVENSLKAMRLDTIDLLLIHRPDPLMDADEMVNAFSRLRESGKVKHFGVSNFTSSQFQLLHSRFPLVTNQVECSLMQTQALEDGSFDLSQQLKMSPMIWSALGGGALFEGKTEQSQRVLTALTKIAAALHTTPATVAIAWLLRLPVKPLILTGSGRVEALREAVRATELVLTRPQWFDLWRASKGYDIP